MSERVVPDDTAVALRTAFDRAFASPPPPAQPEVEDLLVLSLGGDPYAVRLRELSGLLPGRRVVPLPSGTPALLGLMGLRGTVVPVLCLESLLGYALSTAPPAWLMLCGGDRPIALGFSGFEGALRLPASSLHADLRPRATRPFVEQVASAPMGARAVIAISLVVASLWNRPGRARRVREQ